MTNISSYIKNGCGKCSLETKLFRKWIRDTIQEDRIYHIKQHQTFYREIIECELLNFRGVKNGYHQDFQHLIVYIHFFHKMATLMYSFMPDKLQTRKKFFSDFSYGKTLLYP